MRTVIEMAGNRTNWDAFVVDSDAHTREDLMLVMGACGYSAQAFSNGQDVLQALSENVPRILVVELLLPDIDGFELCQHVRDDLRYRNLPIICTSAVSWGSVDLPQLLARRFGARFLPKGSLAKDLILNMSQMLVRRDTPKLAQLVEADTCDLEELIAEEIKNLSLGGDELAKTEKMTRIFENTLANVPKGPARCNARVLAEHEVRFQNLNELLREYSQNISKGGLFVRADDPPQIDDEVYLSVMIPKLDRPVEVQARVVHRISASEAEQYGVPAGFGAQFIDLLPDDRDAIEKLVRDSQEAKSSSARLGPAPAACVVLIGVPVLPMVGRPTFLLRDDVQLVEFPDLSIAEDFLAAHKVNLVIFGENAFEWGDAESCLRRLDTLVDQECERIVMLSRACAQPYPLPRELCQVVIDSSLTMEKLLEELSWRLGLKNRRHLRVPHPASISLSSEQGEFAGRMLNISCGGMLLRSSATLPKGTEISVCFSLPGAPELSCQAVVMRSESENTDGQAAYGLMFSDFSDNAQADLKSFVQGHVNFREFFRWFKKRYFEWP